MHFHIKVLASRIKQNRLPAKIEIILAIALTGHDKKGLMMRRIEVKELACFISTKSNLYYA